MIKSPLKKFLIILALLFSIFLIVSSVSAEDCNIETDGLTDNQLSEEDNSLGSEEDENILVISLINPTVVSAFCEPSLAVSFANTLSSPVEDR